MDTAVKQTYLVAQAYWATAQPRELAISSLEWTDIGTFRVMAALPWGRYLCIFLAEAIRKHLCGLIIRSSRFRSYH